jgi:predicted nucleic acid-binding protein
MSGFITDACVTLAWCFADEATPFTDGLLDCLAEGEGVTVPPHWPTEVLNGLLKAQRRGRITETETQYFLKNLYSFNISVDSGRGLSLLDGIRRLAVRHSLTSYDAAYLDQALRSHLPLATLDGAQLKAAAMEGVAIV